MLQKEGDRKCSLMFGSYSSLLGLFCAVSSACLAKSSFLKITLSSLLNKIFQEHFLKLFCFV